MVKTVKFVSKKSSFYFTWLSQGIVQLYKRDSAAVLIVYFHFHYPRVSCSFINETVQQNYTSPSPTPLFSSTTIQESNSTSTLEFGSTVTTPFSTMSFTTTVPGPSHDGNLVSLSGVCPCSYTFSPCSYTFSPCSYTFSSFSVEKLFENFQYP